MRNHSKALPAFNATTLEQHRGIVREWKGMHHYGNWSTRCVDFFILELFHGSHFAQLLAHALKSIRTNAPSVTVFQSATFAALLSDHSLDGACK
jgi:hypothetical protein